MTEPAPLLDLDDPDKLVRVGDVLAMLETDRDLARAVAEHHQLLKPADAPTDWSRKDRVEMARYVCFILSEGVREQTRRLVEKRSHLTDPDAPVVAVGEGNANG